MSLPAALASGVGATLARAVFWVWVAIVLVAIVVVIVVLGNDPEIDSIEGGARYVLPWLAIGAFAAATLIPTVRVDLAFYEAAAQVIPLLLLAMVIEARFFDVSLYSSRGTTLVAIVTLVGIFAGERAALIALAIGESNNASLMLTGYSIFQTILGIGLLAIVPLRRGDLGEIDEERPRPMNREVG